MLFTVAQRSTVAQGIAVARGINCASCCEALHSRLKAFNLWTGGHTYAKALD